MFYSIYVPPYCDLPANAERPRPEELVFSEIKEANAALKRYKGSRMKIFPSMDEALRFLNEPDRDESFDLSALLATSFERLSVNEHSSPKSPSSNLTGGNIFSSPSSAYASPTRLQLNTGAQSPASPALSANTTADVAADEAEPSYPSVTTAMLNALRRKIECGDYEFVDETIWLNPRYLISVSDSATYLMAGPKYNACHIAARANKPDIMALLLDTISNLSFAKKLYPKESEAILQDRVNHLLDSYLNTPDPRQGNTPLHFASKLGYHRVVRVLLTFEGCDLNLRDINGKTPEESICIQYKPSPWELSQSLSEELRRLDIDERPDGDTNQNKSLVQLDNESSVRQKIKNMFKQQFHLPLYRDQLKKRLILERRRRSRASSQMDSDTSFSDIDDSFILNSPTKQNKSIL